MSTYTITAEFLIGWRQRRSYTRAQAGVALGVAESTIKMYEQGRYAIPVPIAHLCEALDELEFGELVQAGDELKEPKPKARIYRGRGIGKYAEELLADPTLKDESMEKLLERVKERFPGCKTTIGSMRWYASKMRQRGELV